MTDLLIRIAGEAGQGVETAGNTLLGTLSPTNKTIILTFTSHITARD